MRKVAIGIPVIYCDECVKMCLESIKSADSILVIDNNATSGIKEMIKDYNKIVNEKNVYVNPAWNQIMEWFIDTDNDILVILNSDMYLREDAIDVVRAMDWDSVKVVPMPDVVKDFEWSLKNHNRFTQVQGGVAGTMIILTRKMVDVVYPIPEEIKIWFGDDWIYDRLRKNGYVTKIHHGIQAKHGGSRSIVALPEAHEVIEQDKIAWRQVSKSL